MGDPFEPVLEGAASPLLTSAAAVNGVLEMSRFVRDRFKGKTGGDGFEQDFPAANLCKVLFADGSLDAYSVLAYGDAQVYPSNELNRNDAQRAPVFSGAVPTDANAPFVVTVDPTQNGAARAVVSGLAVAQVDVGDLSHRFATPSPGVTKNLVSNSLGTPIVWPQSFATLGPQWCVVRIEGTGRSALPQGRYFLPNFGSLSLGVPVYEYGLGREMVVCSAPGEPDAIVIATGCTIGQTGQGVIGWAAYDPITGIGPLNPSFKYGATGNIGLASGDNFTVVAVLLRQYVWKLRAVGTWNPNTVFCTGLVLIKAQSTILETCANLSGSGSGSGGGGGGNTDPCNIPDGTSVSLVITGGPEAGTYTSTWHTTGTLTGLPEADFTLPITGLYQLFGDSTGYYFSGAGFATSTNCGPPVSVTFPMGNPPGSTSIVFHT